jgi:membrane-bound lytic murein transglycosylase D
MEEAMRKWKNILCVGILLGLSNLRIQAQELPMAETLSDTTELPVSVEVVTDSTVPEALVRERLAKLQNEIPLRYHPVTHQFVEYFIYRKPHFVKRMLEQMHLYFPIYEKYLAQYDMPRELKFLSLIESGLNPRVISYAGAGGLWQFMPRTGKEFGLYQDDYIDERFEPVKATEAACKYLRQLYRVFGDWEMALAAYNVGPGNVKRAMRRSGSNSFWGIYNFLPKQTRHYVPQFVAITYMMHYAADHGIFAETPDYPVLTDTVQVNGYFSLHTFANLSGISLAELYKLNPQLINTQIPPRFKNYILKVPSHQYEFLMANRTAIWDSSMKLPYDPTMVLAAITDSTDSTQAIAKVGGIVAASDEEGDPETIIARKPRKISHKVRRGETLSSIARHYRVDVYDLKKWNRLRSGKVLRNQQLVVYQEVGKRQLLASKSSTKKATATAKIKLRYHRVQPGDTLWTISQRYGLDIARLKKLNRIKGNTVRKGQRLLVG